MSLEKTIQSMKLTVSRHAADFARGQARRAAIASCADPADLLAMLDPKSGLTDEERGAIVAVLVREHQERRGPLWQTILVVAFEPALVRIRRRIGHPTNEELDQKVFEAFIRAILLESVLEAGAFAPAAIVRYVERTALRGEHRARKDARETLELDEETYDGDAMAASEKRAEERVAALLESVSPEQRAVMMATFAHQESLKDYIAECYPTLDEKGRDAVYDRLWAERSLTRERMRAETTAPSQVVPERLRRRVA